VNERVGTALRAFAHPTLLIGRNDGEELDAVEKISSASSRAIGFVFGEDKSDAATHELVDDQSKFQDVAQLFVECLRQLTRSHACPLLAEKS